MDYGSKKKNGIYQFNTKYQKKTICSTLNSRVGWCLRKAVNHTSRTAYTLPTKAERKELNDLNAATGVKHALVKGIICHANYKDGGKVDAVTCAQKCKKQPGCTEFSVGGHGGSVGCRYAYQGGGCCSTARRQGRTRWSKNGPWRSTYCTPFKSWGLNHCSKGSCMTYVKTVITTKAQLWSQFGPSSRMCGRETFAPKQVPSWGVKGFQGPSWEVPSQEACQDAAVASGHSFYQVAKAETSGLVEKTTTGLLCYTVAQCRYPSKTSTAWKIYATPAAAKITPLAIPKVTTRATWWPRGSDDKGGKKNRKCRQDQKYKHRVPTRSECQDEAIAYGHAYYSYNDANKLCYSSTRCKSKRIWTRGWNHYKARR